MYVPIILLAFAHCSEVWPQVNKVPAVPSAIGRSSNHMPARGQSSIKKESISSAVADVFAGLVTEANLHTERNAVEVFAKGLSWIEVPKDLNAMLNAKRAFAGKLANQTVLIGSDGSNDIFAIAVTKSFNPEEFQSRLKGVVVLLPVASNMSMGHKFDVYRLLDGAKDLGFLSINYGVAEAVRGTGTVAYISSARAKREGLAFHIPTVPRVR
jgi:hypothetical protein